MISKTSLAWGTLVIALAPAVGWAADAPAAVDGQAIFKQICAACHQPGGEGLPGLAPPLAGTLAPLLAHDDGRRYMAQVLVHGLSGRIESKGQEFNLAMPPQSALSDAELAAAAGYVARELNQSEGRGPSADEVAAARGAALSHKQLREWRARLLKP
ncbi:MAG: cytochrome c [Burkholderiales bacterium]|nr:cytochrome c [Burkholderiales bacterium]